MNGGEWVGGLVQSHIKFNIKFSSEGIFMSCMQQRTESLNMGGSRKFLQGVLTIIFSVVINKFFRGPYEPPLRSNWTPWYWYRHPQKAIGPLGSNCFSRVSVPVFYGNSIATCDFGEGFGPPVPPLDLIWFEHL